MTSLGQLESVPLAGCAAAGSDASFSDDGLRSELSFGSLQELEYVDRWPSEAPPPADEPPITDDRHAPELLRLLGSELECAPSAIQDFELLLVDCQPSQIWGLNNEFLSSPRLDNQVHCFTALRALLDVVMRYRSFRQGVGRLVLELLQKTERLLGRRNHTFCHSLPGFYLALVAPHACRVLFDVAVVAGSQRHVPPANALSATGP